MLCDMMLRAGLLSEGQVASVRSHVREHGGSDVEAVLALELADEDTIVAFSSSKLMIPRVREAILDRITPDALGRVAAGVAVNHGVLPVAEDGAGNLTVAMADPTDIGAINAVAESTGAYVVRAVAPYAALRRAIERHYGSWAAGSQTATPPPLAAPAPISLDFDGDDGPPAPTPFAGQPSIDHLPPVPPSPALDDPDSSETLLGMPTAETMLGLDELPPSEEPERVDHGRPVEGQLPSADAAVMLQRERSHTPASWNPPLSGPGYEPTPLSPEAFARILPRLVMAVDRDEVTRLLLDFLGAGFRRVILFVHTRAELRGHDSRGPDLVVEAVREVRIPSIQDSVFSRVIKKGTPYFGNMPANTDIDNAFSGAFGGLKGNILLMPIIIGNRVPLMLFAHGTTTPVDPRSINALADGVSGTLTRIITKTKARMTPPHGIPKID